MILPQAFFAEPRFNQASPDFAKLRAATSVGLENPGVLLAVAVEYYRPEAYACLLDREKACGPTAHPDVRYFPVTRAELINRRTALADIACGVSIDHPDFETVMSPLFTQMLKTLLNDAAHTSGEGVVTASTLTIARTRYSISASWNGDWLDFSVDAFSVFEPVGKDVMDRTTRYLNERLQLQLTPQVGRSFN